MKVLILGLTGSGKSTCAKTIADRFALKLIEADDEVIKLNGGIWPKDENVIDKYFEVTNNKVLKEDNILYVISWLTIRRITEFATNGFIIIELHADINELVKRKTKRDKPGLEDLNRFKENYQGYFEVVNDPEIKDTFQLRLDTTNLSPKQVEEKIVHMLSQTFGSH